MRIGTTLLSAIMYCVLATMMPEANADPASTDVPFAEGLARGVNDPEERAVYAATYWYEDKPERAGLIALVNVNTGPLSLGKDLEAKWRATGELQLYPPLSNPSPTNSHQIMIDPERFSEDKSKPPYQLPLSMLDEFQRKNSLRYTIFAALPTEHIRVEFTFQTSEQYANFVGFTENGRTVRRYEANQIVPYVRTFSRVGFNADHTLAIVGWIDQRSPIIGGGSSATWLLAKKDGRWERAKKLGGWVN